VTASDSKSERVRIGSIVIRCYEFERMVVFWRQALGYVVGHADPNGGFVILSDPSQKGPNVSIDQTQIRRTGKRSRLHLDLYTAKQHDEVERLVRLGAKRYAWRYQPGADYVVLEDPDGNLFCVVQEPE
jgi:catechol 2,3-dioxygenase-like lactoylglutathione lyase family enzyme